MENFDLNKYLKNNILLTENVVNEENIVTEMAKIQGELEVAINQVIDENPEMEMKDLRKAIRADEAVKAALADLGKDVELFPNQLNRYILKARGEVVPGKRGRKSSPAAEMGRRVAEFMREPSKVELEGIIADLQAHFNTVGD
jgi:hypothetical protein